MSRRDQCNQSAEVSIVWLRKMCIKQRESFAIWPTNISQKKYGHMGIYASFEHVRQA